MKQRVAYLDLTKLWSIFLVCMGHVFPMLSVGEQALPNRMLYTFHMGLFMLMCGFFSHHALTMPFGPFIKKKALQLLVPTVAYVGLNLLATWVVTGDCPMGFIRDEAIGGIWFLRTLFACYLFAWLVLRLPGALWLRIIGSIVCALLFPHGYYLQFNYMLIFFWVGYVMKGHDGWLQAYVGGISGLAHRLSACAMAEAGSAHLWRALPRSIAVAGAVYRWIIGDDIEYHTDDSDQQGALMQL